VQAARTDVVIRQWIAGEEIHAGETYEIYDPSTAKPYGVAADGGPHDVDHAVESAWKAYEATWSALDSEARSALLVRIADNLKTHTAELAAAESRDTGRPMAFAEAFDGPAMSEELRFYAGAIRSVRDGLHAGSNQTVGMTLRQPYGVVGLIVPSNFPLGVLAEKVSQILVAGNCVVIKPSPLTPASAVLVAKLMTEAGLPPGVRSFTPASRARAERESSSMLGWLRSSLTPSSNGRPRFGWVLARTQLLS
jgi:aminomuconate-semialdehyde/2-hydroxymuconate-6-semialdehyde dehydrogenase